MSEANPLSFPKASELDPSGVEPRTLLAAAPFRHARMLEVGAGDGRLTRRYAGVPRFVAAMDAHQTQIRETAKRHSGLSQVKFLCANAPSLPFPAQSFDIVLFASSL